MLKDGDMVEIGDPYGLGLNIGGGGGFKEEIQKVEISGAGEDLGNVDKILEGDNNDVNDGKGDKSVDAENKEN